MSEHPMIRASWFVLNLLLVATLAAVIYGAGWEFSTRSYLRGFSDAIVPASDNTEQKIEAILQWMAHGPARKNSPDPGALDVRNPENTLNVERLLAVCGSASNAFVNLSQSSGIHARRLLLLGPSGGTKHVVVETLIADRWAVVDPAYRVLFKLPDGRLVTRSELKDPAVFKAVTLSIPDYPATYTYENTAHVRLLRIPLIGKDLRKILDHVWPPWEEAVNWTLLLERASFAMLTASVLLLFFVLAARLLFSWYCSSRLGITRWRLRDQILRAGHFLAGSTH